MVSSRFLGRITTESYAVTCGLYVCLAASDDLAFGGFEVYVVVTFDPMVRFDLNHFGRSCLAFCSRIGASCPEPTSVGYVYGAWDVSLERDELFPLFWVWKWDGGQESFGVRVFRVLEELTSFAQLY